VKQNAPFNNAEPSHEEGAFSCVINEKKEGWSDPRASAYGVSLACSSRRKQPKQCHHDITGPGGNPSTSIFQFVNGSLEISSTEPLLEQASKQARGKDMQCRNTNLSLKIDHRSS
jgi:hypothetical protein